MKKAITEALALVRYVFPKNVKNVVIKPNLCYYQDFSTGQTTDPEFVGAFAEILRSRIPDVRVAVVESDASAMKCKHAFRMLGYESLRDELDVDLVNLSEDVCSTIETSVDGNRIRLMVPKIIQKADLRVNMPKIKYMISGCKISCAMKNIFGCNPYPFKFKYHPMLAETIVAVNKVMPFDLCLVDGFMASGVEPKKLGLVMAGTDCVTIDAEAARIAGFSPRTIRYLRLAQKESLGRMEAERVGVPLSCFAARYPKRSPLMKVKGQIYNLITQVGFGKKLGLQ